MKVRAVLFVLIMLLMASMAQAAQVGDQADHTAGEVLFQMRHAPAAEFITGMDDAETASVEQPFWIAETQVTYELWYTVKQWALANGYTFVNEGQEGSHGSIGGIPTAKRNQPVTVVSWADSIVWCNALSEMLDYQPVYAYQGSVIKDAGNWAAWDHTVQGDTDGFRLPTSMEFELAARYRGNEMSADAVEVAGLYWTPASHASGAGANFMDAATTAGVAWFYAEGTEDVGLKSANALGLYDMSGNVWEWTFTQLGPGRIFRGGSWNLCPCAQTVAGAFGCVPDYAGSTFGFRFARTQF